VLEGARWAPTAHNMQNFEVVAVDDPALLAELAAIEAPLSEALVRETYPQLSFSPDELRRRQTGLLADSFPPAWRDPNITSENLRAFPPASLRGTIRGAPLVLVISYDPRLRAPASEGDVFGMMSLGCVLQNMWLAAQARGVGFHVMSGFASPAVAEPVKRVLAIPGELKIAYAVGLGYADEDPERYLRVRRDLHRFVHRNRDRSASQAARR